MTKLDTSVRHELAMALGIISGDYDTWFARGKILAWKHHLSTADKLMQVFDITKKEGITHE